MSQATETMQVFIDAVSQLDVPRIDGLFAADVVQRVPFAPEGTPDTITGKEAVMQTFGALPLMFRGLEYTDVEIIETADPNFAVAFADASGTLTSGDAYKQRYVFYMELDTEGKIAHYREYMNPVELAKVLQAIGVA